MHVGRVAANGARFAEFQTTFSRPHRHCQQRQGRKDPAARRRRRIWRRLQAKARGRQRGQEHYLQAAESGQARRGRPAVEPVNRQYYDTCAAAHCIVQIACKVYFNETTATMCMQIVYILAVAPDSQSARMSTRLFSSRSAMSLERAHERRFATLKLRTLSLTM